MNFNDALAEAIIYSHKTATKTNDYWAFLNGLADTQDAGKPFDETHSKVFADFLQEHNSPLSTLVRAAKSFHHIGNIRTHGLSWPPYSHPELPESNDGDHLDHSVLIPYIHNLPIPTREGLHVFKYYKPASLSGAPASASKPVLKWQTKIPGKHSTTGKARWLFMTAPVTTEDYHTVVEALPDGVTKQRLVATAQKEGWHKEGAL